jgi:hypothetical protein
VQNTEGQLPAAFKSGQYALANLIYAPVQSATTGLEIQWGRRTNFSDGFGVNDFRVVFQAKYSFSFDLGGRN